MQIQAKTFSKADSSGLKPARNDKGRGIAASVRLVPSRFRSKPNLSPRFEVAPLKKEPVLAPPHCHRRAEYVFFQSVACGLVKALGHQHGVALLLDNDETFFG
jgi:hypothetical protein